jgi:glutathionylspermidine synthase
MQRTILTPRADWQHIVEQHGLLWHTIPGQTTPGQTGDKPYWDESACYRFTAREVDTLEAATLELYRLVMAAGQHIIDNNLFPRFGIPDFIVPLIKRAWDAEPPALNHGRFDLGFDGVHPPKMFEYNCDTPTAMLETAVVQWEWMEAVFPKADQFNSLHDKLLAKWQDIGPYLKSRGIHFTHMNDHAAEDTITVSYLRDLAEQAGINSTAIFTKDIGWNATTKRFVDLESYPIDVLFHLYPWEWLVNEEFGPRIVDSYDAMDWIEPVWKMMLSNKAILPVLWELFPGHPNLLPCYSEPRGAGYVKKPLLSREGANITIVKDGKTLAGTEGDYGHEGFVYQELFDLPDYDGNRPVLGSWIVDGDPAGMGIREDGLITGNTARFVPHIFE